MISIKIDYKLQQSLLSQGNSSPERQKRKRESSLLLMKSVKISVATDVNHTTSIYKVNKPPSSTNQIETSYLPSFPCQSRSAERTCRFLDEFESKKFYSLSFPTAIRFLLYECSTILLESLPTNYDFMQ